MSVKVEPSGRRSVEVETEVPGTPEEVWRAIATGPGVSSWFVPTRFEEPDGKPAEVVCDFGPGMESRATVTAWEPPRRFAAESRWSPEAPPIATEWFVEARAGGVCSVRVVHSLFASDDEWDDQLTGTEIGWPVAFHVLRLYLSRFRGQRCEIVQVMGTFPGTTAEAWTAVTASLGLAGAEPGERRTAPDGAPPLAGVVERSVEGQQLLVRTDRPGPGVAQLYAVEMGGAVPVGVRLYLYGEEAPAVAAGAEPGWRRWLEAITAGRS
jgi:uncharacterized protein YndB with AHSA1/START domain